MTKLSAQVSVLLSEKKHCPDPRRHAVAASYQNKGTLKTMANIVRHRGLTGLYTGLKLHLRRPSPSALQRLHGFFLTFLQSAIPSEREFTS